MTLQTTTARQYFTVLLAVAMATQLTACSKPGPGKNEDVAGTADSAADAPAPPATVTGEAASVMTTPAATAPDPAGAGAASVVSESATVGGDGSEITLAPLSSADIDGAALKGELGCSFSIGDTPPLLVAMGDVASKEPSRGVVKVGDYVEAVMAPGGFDAMVKGAQFSGAGKTIRITVTGAAIGSDESPPAPATLTYDRADGARRSFAGQWQCGP